MNEVEKVYQFNEYVLEYDKGHNDRSCLIISKIQNENIYVMSSLYDGSADVISIMLDSFQQEISSLNNIIDEKDTEITILKNKLDMIKNNVDDLIKRKDKQTILDIIEIYTGFWGKGDESE